MKEKKKVRIKPGSPLTRRLSLAPEAVGTVICQYRVLREGEAAPDRMDVRFDDRQVIWGAPEKEFELLSPFRDA